MRERLLHLFAEPGYRPMTKSELARALELHPDQRAEMRRALGELQAEGLVLQGRKARWELAAAKAARGSVRGRFEHDFRARPVLTVLEVPPNSALRIGERIPVALHASGTALPGDEVLASLSRKPLPRHLARRGSTPPGDWPEHEARVQDILRREFREVVGVLHRRGRFGWVEPVAEGLPPFELDPQQPLTPPLTDLPEAGSTVVLRFTGWDGPRARPRGSLTEVLEAPSRTRLAIEILIRKLQLPREFPPEVRAEAQDLPARPQPEDFLGREDWRDRPVFTIDPEDARDFDDAIFVQPRRVPAVAATEQNPSFNNAESATNQENPENPPTDGWELTVHIADVAHYVSPGSALDREARLRGNSTYLADRVIPMLPEELSNGLCSLVPDQPRLTRAVTMSFDARGRPVGTPHFFSAVIHSQHRFAYPQVQARFDQADAPPATRFPAEIDAQPENSPPASAGGAQEPTESVIKALFHARALAQTLRRRRFAQGALDLDFPELKVLTDADGNPTGYRIERSDESHQLIEECMLAANEAVARKLLSAEVTALHRVHDDPDPTRLFELRELARSWGHPVGDLTDRKSLQNLLAEVKGKPEEQAVKIATLKSMARARYDAASLGHYGLAKEAYTHFTSPIRRYADLVVHRALYGRVLAKQDPAAPPVKPLPAAQAAEIAEHISRTERVSAEAESGSRRILLLAWLATQCHPHGAVLQGFIGEVRPRSAFVDLPELSLRGMLKIEDLPPDHYRFDHARGALVGRHTDIVLAPGLPVRVRPVRVDQDNQFLDLTVV